MKFGVMNLFPQTQSASQSGVFNESLEEIQLAEEMGFDSVWLAEHHFSPYGLLGNPLVFAAAVAQRTRRVKIGTAVMILPFYNPIRLAEDAAVVDMLSQGRLMLGVGRGYQPIEFEGFGVNPDESRSRTRETLDILRLAWTQDSFSYQGQHFQYKDLSVYPKPYQKPHPPLLTAAVSPQTFTDAGRKGEPILTSPNFTPLPLVKQSFQIYCQTLAENGFNPAEFDLPLMHQVFVADNRADLQTAAEASLNYYRLLGSLLPGAARPASKEYSFYAKVTKHIDMLSVNEALATGGNFGGVDEVIERLKVLRDDVGVNHYICWFRFGTLERKKALRAMETFATKVMPALRSSAPGAAS